MKKTVLVVEDQEMNREILKALLEDRYTVIGAENGLEALEILKTDSERISAILLDIISIVLIAILYILFLTDISCTKKFTPITLSAPAFFNS